MSTPALPRTSRDAGAGRSPLAAAARWMVASSLGVTLWFLAILGVLLLAALALGDVVGLRGPDDAEVRIAVAGGWNGPANGFVLVLSLLAPLGLLAPAVMGGLTRRAFSRACALTAAVVVAVLTTVYVLSAAVQSAVAGPGPLPAERADRPAWAPRPGLYETGDQLLLFGLQTAGLLACYAAAGLLIGWAYYRFAAWATLALPVLVLPVVAGEVVVRLDAAVAVRALLLLAVPVVAYVVAEQLLTRTPLRTRPQGR